MSMSIFVSVAGVCKLPQRLANLRKRHWQALLSAFGADCPPTEKGPIYTLKHRGKLGRKLCFGFWLWMKNSGKESISHQTSLRQKGTYHNSKKTEKVGDMLGSRRVIWGWMNIFIFWKTSLSFWIWAHFQRQFVSFTGGYLSVLQG